MTQKYIPSLLCQFSASFCAIIDNYKPRIDNLPMTVGVLAFQGDFAEHLQVLAGMGVPAMEVRNLTDLARVEKLIIPGGESTVMAKFLAMTGVGDEIVRRVQEKQKPLVVYGTCAGAIVLAKRAYGKNSPRTLGLIDIDVQRNAYGPQIDSFEATLKVDGIKGSLDVAFIRAPIITRVGKGVKVLASHKGKPVLVQQGRVLAGTFHPEVRRQAAIHEMFLRM
jgi:pyridoxal 5'-phosphate synthase pdxT subunit